MSNSKLAMQTASTNGHESLVAALRRSSYSALRTLQVEIDGGSLVLRGTVPSYYLKQLAQTHAGRAVASYRIVNEIEVSACSTSRPS